MSDEVLRFRGERVGRFADAGLDFGSLTRAELSAIRAAAADGAQEGARRAAKEVIEKRREAEVTELRKRLKDLGG
jgi:hypothetical protein